MADLEEIAAKNLPELGRAEERCRRCELYKAATQVVPGEGRAHASLMFVGEQPGDVEDKTGRPFVGPAGRVLDEAFSDAGIARAETFVTNAVKHFKHEMRGKRRLHKRPNAYEVERCRWWFDQEVRIVQPQIVVALGGTAARSIMGRNVVIARARNQFLEAPDGRKVLVTIHPSYLLRIRDKATQESEYKKFVSDLKRARAAVGA